jgi:hypothetical protein
VINAKRAARFRAAARRDRGRASAAASSGETRVFKRESDGVTSTSSPFFDDDDDDDDGSTCESKLARPSITHPLKNDASGRRVYVHTGSHTTASAW